MTRPHLAEAAALEQGLAVLRAEVGKPDLTPVATKLVNWLEDPYTRGGYSYVLPGHEGVRALLAKATPPLYWAGEATAPDSQAATVHGAYVSGQRAAHEVLEGLSKPRTAHRRLPAPPETSVSR